MANDGSVTLTHEQARRFCVCEDCGGTGGSGQWDICGTCGAAGIDPDKRKALDALIVEKTQARGSSPNEWHPLSTNPLPEPREGATLLIALNRYDKATLVYGRGLWTTGTSWLETWQWRDHCLRNHPDAQWFLVPAPWAR